MASAHLVAVALREAAGDDDPGPGLAPVGQREDRVDRLLAGLLDEGARVDDDDIGVGGRVGRNQPVGQQDPVSLSESTWFFGQPNVSTQKCRVTAPG